MTAVINLFTFIGVGVVIGLIVGLIMGLIGDPPAWGIGAVAGVTASVAGWYVQRRTGT